MVEYVGEILTREQASEREGWYAEQLMPCSYSLFAEVFVIDPTLYGNAARFINASCDPTVRPTEFKAARWAPGLANAPRVLFVATRDIAAGEELTWGYKAGAAQKTEKAVRSVYGGRRSQREREAEPTPAATDRVPCVCGAACCKKWA